MSIFCFVWKIRRVILYEVPSGEPVLILWDNLIPGIRPSASPPSSYIIWLEEGKQTHLHPIFISTLLFLLFSSLTPFFCLILCNLLYPMSSPLSHLFISFNSRFSFPQPFHFSILYIYPRPPMFSDASYISLDQIFLFANLFPFCATCTDCTHPPSFLFSASSVHLLFFTFLTLLSIIFAIPLFPLSLTSFFLLFFSLPFPILFSEFFFSFPLILRDHCLLSGHWADSPRNLLFFLVHSTRQHFACLSTISH